MGTNSVVIAGRVLKSLEKDVRIVMQASVFNATKSHRFFSTAFVQIVQMRSVKAVKNAMKMTIALSPIQSPSFISGMQLAVRSFLLNPLT